MALNRTEADVERVRAAIAEAGHPLSVQLRDDGYIAFDPATPDYVAWKAMAVSGIAACCWPCDQRRGDRRVNPPVPCNHPIDPFCPERAA